MRQLLPLKAFGFLAVVPGMYSLPSFPILLFLLLLLALLLVRQALPNLRRLLTRTYSEWQPGIVISKKEAT